MHRLMAGWFGILVVVLCICAPPPARAAPSFHSDKDYPDLGLRIRVLGNSAPEPLPQCRTFTYEFTRGAEKFKRDMYDPRELWYASQHAGQWRDEAGNVLVLGRATRLPPVFAEKHVPREGFEDAMNSPACLPNPADARSLAAWVRAFAGCATGEPEPLKQRHINFSLADALFYPVADEPTLICAFRVKTRKRSGQVIPSDWFCAIVRTADGTEKSKVRKDFESQFLANLGPVSAPGTGASDVRPKELSVETKPGAKSAAAVQDSPSRAAARRSIANMKDWWFAETPEYIFLSDIRSNAGRALVRELQTDMPALREAFARLVPPFETTSDTSVVRVYEDRDAYKRYVGKDMEWSSGAWIPMRRELVILAQENDREKTLTIIRHEGFHQYLFYACGMLPNAPWFDEGHASLFESVSVDRRGRVEIGEGARCNRLIGRLDAATALIPRLIRMDHAAFYDGADDQRDLNYSTAWGLVYYLQKGAPARKQAAYAGVIPAYLTTLASEKKPDAATAAAFAGIDMTALQRDFSDFWKKWRQAARRYDPLEDGR